MLTVAEALSAVRGEACPLPPRRSDLAASLGQILARDVVADRDLPPFDKALVDGFAVRSADLAGPDTVALRVVEEIFAGATPTRAVGPGEASAIMTGAPLPEGADAVVMVERTSRPSSGTVVVVGPLLPGQNRLLRGREMRAGDVVVPGGTRLNPAMLGVMASVGVSETLVHPRPRVAIAATGDELVPFDETPGPGRIRNSNTIMLAALAREHGASDRPLPIIPDRAEALIDAFRRALQGEPTSPEPADILLVSGGVSAGRRDLVPEALEAIGARCVFHKVRVKPGKPLWFGVGPGRAGLPPALIFGLPGNPVSGLVSFLLFVRPAIEILSGTGTGEPPTAAYPLAVAYSHSDDRDTYRPCRLVGAGADLRVEPLDSAGSSDLRASASGDGFAIFPAGERIYGKGEPVGFLDLCPPRFRAGCSYYTWPPGAGPSRDV